MATKTLNADEIHERQRRYVEEIERQGYDYGLVVAAAFVKSIRDIGYKSTGTALNELVDNAVEAGAQNVHVVFGYPSGSRKPNSVAILDDGIGMIPGMLRAAVVWGGTDRHDSRQLYGRFGYGLPSASVSQAKRLTVLSRPDGGGFHAVVMDLDDIEAGTYLDEKNRVVVPEPRPADIPSWIVDYAKASFPGGVDAIRTLVVWEKLDRHTYKTAAELENHILETFGVTYRNLLRNCALAVNGKPVDAVDPLFLTEGARFYDLDEERAIPEEPITFEVRDPDSKESLGWVKVRFALMPPSFARVDKTRTDSNRSNQNKRFPILKDHNGVIALRNGRQIDVVTKGAPTSFKINDRYVGLEVDFPATLDEFFGVTTHKQQITISDRIWGLLKEAGVWNVFSRLRKQYEELNDDYKTQMDTPSDDGARPSELAMEEAEVLDLPALTPRVTGPPEVQGQREEKVESLVREGMSRAEAEREIIRIEIDHPYRVAIESLPGAPFYRVEQRGNQIVLLVNRSHAFFSSIYAAVPGPNGARLRQALEVLLFVMGKAEVDASDEVKVFYASERQLWSTRLTTALAKLGKFIDLTDEIAEGDELEVGVE